MDISNTLLTFLVYMLRVIAYLFGNYNVLTNIRTRIAEEMNKRNLERNVHNSPTMFESQLMDIVNNEDIMMHFLKWLPTRCIFKFRTVSKKWNEILSSKHFFSIFRPNLDPCGFILHGMYSPPRVMFMDHRQELRYMHSWKDHSLNYFVCSIQSCNGLLLYCQDYEHEPVKKCCICNPFTREYRRLVLPSTGSFVGLAMAFDPNISIHYKIICVMRVLENGAAYNLVHIYSSGTHSWRLSRKTTSMITTKLESQVYWRGSVYWFSHPNYAVCFDVEAETFRTLDLPSSNRSFCFFKVCNENLYLIDVGYSGREHSDTFVFKLEQVPGSMLMSYRWTVTFYIPFGLIFPRIPLKLRRFRTSGTWIQNMIVRNGEFALVIMTSRALLAYFPISKDVEVLQRYTGSPSSLVYSVDDYVETVYFV